VRTKEGQVTKGRSSASLLLIHGAGSGPLIFANWFPWFPRIEVRAVDLQENLDIEHAAMGDYAAVVVEAAHRLAGSVALCGWSMGGLVAMLASQQVRPHRLVLIEPSPPAEIQGAHLDAELVPGRFDPEEVYGQFPPGQAARAESSLARSERKRGISVPSVPCPTLVVYGSEFPIDRGWDVAKVYGAEELCFPDLDHWGLITDNRVPQAIARYLGEW
jgi:pimeloyl-ACP methyl ester carboxylesterase